MLFHTEDTTGGAAYKHSKIASFKEGLRLEDLSILTNLREFDEEADFQIQSIFPQLVVQQIQNSLAVRQLLPKGPDNFELIFNFFGYSDDSPEMRMQRIKQANLVGSGRAHLDGGHPGYRIGATRGGQQWRRALRSRYGPRRFKDRKRQIGDFRESGAGILARISGVDESMSHRMLADWDSLFMETTVQEIIQWYDLHRLQDRYVSVIDSDRLEEWPDLFTDDCVYEIVPKENADLGLPVGIMHCFGRPILCDRVVSLRNANVFEPHTYRHLTSGLEIAPVDCDTIDMQSNYVVVQTLTDGESRVYQAGRYLDRVVRTAQGWRYQRKRAVYDTSRVQTLLVAPI